MMRDGREMGWDGRGKQIPKSWSLLHFEVACMCKATDDVRSMGNYTYSNTVLGNGIFLRESCRIRTLTRRILYTVYL
jgi:hypothetical protein